MQFNEWDEQLIEFSKCFHHFNDVSLYVSILSRKVPHEGPGWYGVHGVLQWRGNLVALDSLDTVTFLKSLVSEAGVNIRKCQRLPLTLVDDLGFLLDVLNWRWPHNMHFMHDGFGTLRRCHCTSKSPNSCWISSLLSKSPTFSWFKILRWDAADKSLLWSYGFHTMPNLFWITFGLAFDQDTEQALEELQQKFAVLRKTREASAMASAT